MSIRTDFYLLKQTDEESRLLAVCRIIEKAYLKSHKIYVFSEDKKQAEILDKLLWTFSDTSFIPHFLHHNTADAPILIGHNSSPPADFHDILVNLSDAAPDFFNQFQRIIEVIPENPEAREKAREKYRFYREQHCELHSHHL
jgi:DNA polymerase-3 subunit chi